MRTQKKQKVQNMVTYPINTNNRKLVTKATFLYKDIWSWKQQESKFSIPIEVTYFLTTRHSDDERCKDILYCETPFGVIELFDRYYQWGTWKHLIECLKFNINSYWITWASNACYRKLYQHLAPYCEKEYQEKHEIWKKETAKKEKRARIMPGIEKQVEEFKKYLMEKEGILN